MTIQQAPVAPNIEACEWLNTPTPLSLTSLRGRVVAIHAFQMLCPGCVSHGRIRLNHLGRLNDMQVGNFVGQLLNERGADAVPYQHSGDDVVNKAGCDPQGCRI